MNYVMTLFTFVLLISSASLTVYNSLFAFRLSGVEVNKGTGIKTPGAIKKLYSVTVFLSAGVTLILLAIFINSLLSANLLGF